jgi:hypothetical protein
MDAFPILETTKRVVDNAKFVRIHGAKGALIAKRVRGFIEKNLGYFEASFNYSPNPKINIQRILVQNAANFCFWARRDGEPKWAIKWQGRTIGGGFGLWAAVDRALAEQRPILSASYLATIPLSDVQKIFRPANGIQIPQIEKRWQNLQEVGRVLLEKYAGEAAALVDASNSDAVALVRLIAQDFSSYNDIATYEGETIYFYKRAQVCASEIDASGAKLQRMDQLTAFADYKIPQLLRHHGILEYAPELARRVDSYELIAAGSKEEVEIRAATIWAVEQIKQQIPQFTAAQIDNALWLISQEAPKNIAPYHRTETIFY